MMNIELVEIKHLIQTEDMDIWNYKDELTALIDEAIDRQMVKSEEVADAMPVVRGEWVEHEYEMECPQCGYFWNYCDNDTERFNYCPNCGAKMEDKS